MMPAPTTVHGIQLDRSELVDICRRYSVARLSVFGSALRDDFGDGSDIDFLVECEPDASVLWYRSQTGLAGHSE